MNPKLKNFLIICGGILLFVSAIGAIFLFEHLLDIFINALYAFLLAKTSSEVLAFFGTLAIFLAVGVSCYDCISSVLFLQKRLQAAISLSKMKIVVITFFLKYIMTRQ